MQHSFWDRIDNNKVLYSVIISLVIALIVFECVILYACAHIHFIDNISITIYDFGGVHIELYKILFFGSDSDIETMFRYYTLRQFVCMIPLIYILFYVIGTNKVLINTVGGD